MASVGKTAFSASASDCKGTGQILCQVPQAIFPSLFFFEHLHTKTAKSLSEDGGGEGKGSRITLLFSLCVCVEPSGAKIIKINIYESSRYFFFELGSFQGN